MAKSLPEELTVAVAQTKAQAVRNQRSTTSVLARRVRQASLIHALLHVSASIQVKIQVEISCVSAQIQKQVGEVAKSKKNYILEKFLCFVRFCIRCLV
jgi:Flp pilus assembly secretin CpaC